MDPVANKPRRSGRRRTSKFHVVDLRLDRHALRYAKNWKQVKQYQATPDGRATNARALKKYRATDNGKAVIAAGGKRYRASDHGKAVIAAKPVGVHFHSGPGTLDHGHGVRQRGQRPPEAQRRLPESGDDEARQALLP